MSVNTYLRRKVKSDFSRNVLILFSGSTIAQLIPFIVSPILSRLYGPENFGLVALFISSFSIISIIVTLQYESAILLPKDEKDAVNLVFLCLVITSCVSLIALILVVLLNGPLTKWLKTDHISFWLYFIPIPIFMTGLYNTLNYWASRKKQYKRLAIRSISQSTTTSIVKVFFGLTGALKDGLIIGTLVGQATATGVLTWLTWKDFKAHIKDIHKNETLKNAVIYKNFPKYTAWQGFFDMFNASGTNFIISIFFGTAVLGLYSLTLGMLQKPLQLIGGSIAQVYYQKASELYNNGENIWILTKKIIAKLFIISILIFTPIAIAGPRLFSIIFGNEWRDAGIYAQLLLPWLIVRFVTSPITSSVNIIGKQKRFFFLTLAINIFFPIALYFAFKMHYSFNHSLLFVSIITCIYFLSILIWIKNLLINEGNKY